MLATSVRRRFVLILFVVGLLSGGFLTATALAVLGAPLQALLTPQTRWALVGVFAAVLALRAWGLVRVPLPENRRLVPDTVFLKGPTRSSLQFGVEMGSGVRTFVPSVLPYLLAVAVACVATTVEAWAAGVGFGAGRALMTWASTRGGDPSAWRMGWTSNARLAAALLGSSVAVSLAMLARVGLVPA